MNKRSHWHCMYNLNYHLVLVTKYRNKCLTKTLLTELKLIFNNLAQKWDCSIIEFNGEPDHIHLLFSAHPSLDLSKLINNWKTVSSRMIRKKFLKHLTQYYWKPVLWTRAYCLLSTGGVSIEIIKKYIENQGKKNPRREGIRFIST